MVISCKTTNSCKNEYYGNRGKGFNMEICRSIVIVLRLVMLMWKIYCWGLGMVHLFCMMLKIELRSMRNYPWPAVERQINKSMPTLRRVINI